MLFLADLEGYIYLCYKIHYPTHLILLRVPLQFIQKLNLVQDTVSRLTGGVFHWEHVTPVLPASWLPIGT